MIKKLFNDKNFPILIDEEGGRVSRFSKIIDTKIFTAEYFGNLYKKNKKKFNLYLLNLIVMPTTTNMDHIY